MRLVWELQRKIRTQELSERELDEIESLQYWKNEVFKNRSSLNTRLLNMEEPEVSAEAVEVTVMCPISKRYIKKAAFAKVNLTKFLTTIFMYDRFLVCTSIRLGCGPRYLHREAQNVPMPCNWLLGKVQDGGYSGRCRISKSHQCETKGKYSFGSTTPTCQPNAVARCNAID